MESAWGEALPRSPVPTASQALPALTTASPRPPRQQGGPVVCLLGLWPSLLCPPQQASGVKVLARELHRTGGHWAAGWAWGGAQ